MYDDPKKNLDYALEFTGIYKGEPNIAKREAACLRKQLTCSLRPIYDGDLVLGGVTSNIVGFNQQRGGHGYYFVEDFYEEELGKIEGIVDIAYLRKLKDMAEFWKAEQTNERVEKRFRETYAGEWNDGGFFGYSCRLAGMNLDLGLLAESGLCGLKDRIDEYRRINGNSDFYDAMEESVGIIADVCRHYAAEARKKGMAEQAGVCERIAVSKPETFKEALQLVWIYAFCDDLMNYSRLDSVLGDFYARDVDVGTLTEDEAVDLLCSLYRHMILTRKIHDSRIIIGGQGRKSPENADRMALAFIRASRKLKDPIPQLTLRYYRGMDGRLLEETLVNIQEGAVYPIIYSDETTVPAVMKIYGCDRETAERWVPFGCGEYVIEGYGVGTPNTVAWLPRALDLVLHRGINSFTGQKELDNMPDPGSFKTFEDLFAAYDAILRPACDMMAYHEQLNYEVAGEQACYLHHSLLTHDCVERGKPLLSGGVRFFAATNEIFGIMTCADSMTAIKELVYDKKALSLRELTAVLDANFEGYEKERRLCQNVPKYGNDDEAADAMAKRVFDHISLLNREAGKKTKVFPYMIVSVNNSGSAEMGAESAATACGRKSGTPWNNGNGPSIGADVSGLTALLNSMAKMDPEKHVGVIHNIRLNRKMLKENRDKIKILLEAFFENNGVQVNLSSIGKDDLEKALEKPEEYRDLLVRIGGFSARFVELNKIVQNEIVARTTYEEV